MTIEERKERFFSFDGCFGKACAECSYGNRTEPPADCREAIHEDAKLIMKHSAGNEDIKEFEATIRPIKYETPLGYNAREQIRELIRLKTSFADLSSHFIQEINELCVELNNLAATIGKRLQVTNGTDPVAPGTNAEELNEAIAVNIANAIDELADVFNYLFVLGYEHKFPALKISREEKLARWANRLNGVSDE